MRGKRALPLFAVSTLALLLIGNSGQAQQTEPPMITGAEPSSTATTPGAKVMIVGKNFPRDAIVYFGGLQAREIVFLNTSALEAVTPYLRPGRYKLDLKSGGATIRSDVSFAALPAPADSAIDEAEGLAAKKQIDSALSIFTSIAETHPDYDVRAYARFRAGQLYLARGDYWAAGEQAGLIWDRKVSMGAQTSWRYRLLTEQISYSVSESNDRSTDLRAADGSVEMDETENPEPRFWRALVSARFGNMEQARADLRFVLLAEPDNPSYRALAAYMDVLAGHKTQLEALRGQQVDDERALRLLGQAAYIMGDYDGAQTWWTGQARVSAVWARMDCLAGRKHVNYGQPRVGAALLAECVSIAPDSREGKEAKELLANLPGPASRE